MSIDFLGQRASNWKLGSVSSLALFERASSPRWQMISSTPLLSQGPLFRRRRPQKYPTAQNPQWGLWQWKTWALCCLFLWLKDLRILSIRVQKEDFEMNNRLIKSYIFWKHITFAICLLILCPCDDQMYHYKPNVIREGVKKNGFIWDFVPNYG